MYALHFLSHVHLASFLNCIFCLDAIFSVQFAVTENGVELIDLGVYIHPPEVHITEVYPLSGPVEGGTLITVLGSRFLAEHPPFCQFGDLLGVKAEVKSFFLQVFIKPVLF